MKDANHTAPPRPHRRRWFQFTLGSLLLLMLVCGVLFGYVAQYRREAERERPVIAAIEELGGTCETAPRGPVWLRWCAGKESSTRVVGADLSYRVTDIYAMTTTGECIHHRKDLSKCVTDESLPDLRELKCLESLDLTGSAVTGQGLAFLRRLRKLKALVLDRCPIDDQGLAHMEGLQNLQSLDVRGTEISEEGLRHLGGLKNLEVLRIDEAAHPVYPPQGLLTEAFFRHLEGLPRLRVLEAGGIVVSDAGIRALEALPALTELDFSASRVLKSGLTRISNLRTLHTLHLNAWAQGTEANEIAQLETACPKLKIIGGSTSDPDRAGPPPNSSVSPDEPPPAPPPPRPPDPPPNSSGLTDESP